MFKSEFLVVKNRPNTGFSQTVPKDGSGSGKPPARVCSCANNGKRLNWAPAMRCRFSFVVGGQRSWSTMKFPRGVVTVMASEFRVSHDIIRRIWKRAVENFNDPGVKQFCASPQKINNCGRPHKWNRDELQEAVKAVPSNQQKTIRRLAHSLWWIPKSTLLQ